MSDPGFDPFANVPSHVPQDDVRNLAADLVRGGLSVEAVNQHLAARGAAPLAADSVEIAESKLAGLMRDRAFVQRWNDGDPGATAEMQLLTLRIAQGGRRLTDRDPLPSDFNIRIGERLPGNSEQAITGYQGELAKFAADVKFRPDQAKSFVDVHLDSAATQNGMTAEQVAEYGQQQTDDLLKVLGPDGPARMKAASETLTRVSGRTLDLSKVVASNGAQAALMLLFQAEVLARTGK